MLVNLSKKDLEKIVFWLNFTEDKPLAEKLEPLIKQCTCKEDSNVSK